MSNRIPGNAVAEIILKLESENEGLSASVASSQSWIETNTITIAELEPYSIWLQN